MTGIHQALSGFFVQPPTPAIAAFTTSTLNNADFATHTYPAGVVSGDLVLVLTTIPTSGPINGITSFTLLDDFVSGTTQHLAIYYRIAAGSLSGTFTQDLTGSSIDYAATVFRITSRQGTPEITTTTASATTTPDPAVIAPSWGAASSSLIITATAYNLTNSSASAYPTGYTYHQNSTAASLVSTSLATAARRMFTSSENPGSFTVGSSANTCTATIAVRSS